MSDMRFAGSHIQIRFSIWDCDPPFNFLGVLALVWRQSVTTAQSLSKRKTATIARSPVKEPTSESQSHVGGAMKNLSPLDGTGTTSRQSANQPRSHIGHSGRLLLTAMVVNARSVGLKLMFPTSTTFCPASCLTKKPTPTGQGTWSLSVQTVTRPSKDRNR